MSIRHKCFISYHKHDSDEVNNFIKTFDNNHDVFIYRAVREMDNNIINSNNHDYIMRRIRELYLTNSTVTIVMIGQCTWSRKYVDWEIASTLRNDSINKRSGLMAITLPSVANIVKTLPPRFNDNLNGDNGYAKWYKYPTSASSLANMIEEAFQARTQRSHLVNNQRELFGYNRTC